MNRYVYLLLIVLISACSGSQNEELLEVAIEGYDPVAYLHENKAIKGDEAIRMNHEGKTYFFMEKGHLELFKSNPEAYLPQYDGWCAYAVGKFNNKVPINPETFKVIDGKTYLFFNKEGNNTLLKWNKDEENLLKKADKNWVGMDK